MHQGDLWELTAFASLIGDTLDEAGSQVSIDLAVPADIGLDDDANIRIILESLTEPFDRVEDVLAVALWSVACDLTEDQEVELDELDQAYEQDLDKDEFHNEQQQQLWTHDAVQFRLMRRGCCPGLMCVWHVPPP